MQSGKFRNFLSWKRVRYWYIKLETSLFSPLQLNVTERYENQGKSAISRISPQVGL